ncbi:hypothetical protein LCGC14_2925400, partial [marine sediment metagenome]
SALTKSTSSFPVSSEHATVAVVLCQSAASLQTDGAFHVHVWTDHVAGGLDSDGHLAHLNYWIRQQHATWDSGVALTSPSIGANVFDIVTSSGFVHQLHTHTMPALTTVSSTDPLWMVNDNSTAYKRVANLTTEVTDSDGNGLTGKHYNIVVWGSVSQSTGDCKIFINLPSGSYNTSAKSISDDDKTANYNIPNAFRGSGFLIGRLSVGNTGGSGGTFTLHQNEDLRGQLSSIFAGGTAATVTEFTDTAFRVQDDGDATKEIALQASAITTSTTRTITMPDENIDLTPSTGSYVSKFFLPPYITGRYYLTAIAKESTNLTMAVNTLYGMPFSLRARSQAFDRIFVEIITAEAAKTMRMGIYNIGSDGLPGSLVDDSGTVSIA